MSGRRLLCNVLPKTLQTCRACCQTTQISPTKCAFSRGVACSCRLSITPGDTIVHFPSLGLLQLWSRMQLLWSAGSSQWDALGLSCTPLIGSHMFDNGQYASLILTMVQEVAAADVFCRQKSLRAIVFDLNIRFFAHKKKKAAQGSHALCSVLSEGGCRWLMDKHLCVCTTCSPGVRQNEPHFVPWQLQVGHVTDHVPQCSVPHFVIRWLQIVMVGHMTNHVMDIPWLYHTSQNRAASLLSSRKCIINALGAQPDIEPISSTVLAA